MSDVARVVDRTLKTVAHDFGDGVRRVVAQPITFTPFASAKACSARCVFCSETLSHVDTEVAGASLRPSARYGAQLRRALRAIEGLSVGVSLSGLESTDDAAWLADVLDAVDAHAARSPVEERVLYTNGAGLVDDENGAGSRLVARLAKFALTRAEVSRHAVDEIANDSIMRFRDGVAVRANAKLATVVHQLRAARIGVRLVCVIQRGGVDDVASARRYLAFARELGVDDVVFRELSRTGEAGAHYVANRALAIVDERRVPIDALRGLVEARGVDRVEATRGYYFANERFLVDGVLVTLEHSDYLEMKARHRSDVVYKLVFFANGSLCADWDPERAVLLRAGVDE